jgi:tetratricopeptide (TPR) repeat protein
MMAQDNDLQVFEIPVSDFDLALIPAEHRSPGTAKFESAVKTFYESQLRKFAADYSIAIEKDKIRVTWRKSSTRPDALEEAISALQKGDYSTGIQILEFLAPSREQDAALHYNLGMAYSDLGKLSQAIDHLTRALEIQKDFVNAKVALGVAHARLKNYDKAKAVLQEAVLEDPNNGYALRNLGAVLMQSSENQDALRYLERAVKILPNDQQAWLGLAQAQMESGDPDGADESLIKVIEIQPYNQLAGTAKEMRSRIAQVAFRVTPSGSLRMDAVMYCLAALQKFSEMTPDQVKNVGFEIATVGMNGINVNDPKSEYHLRTLPGTFTGLQLLCYEYVAFKQFAPEMDIGFDVSKEYEEAQKMSRMGL